MTFYEFGDDDMVMAAQSCKLFRKRPSYGISKSPAEGISCGICSNWTGSRCGKRVLDNTLSVPEFE